MRSVDKYVAVEQSTWSSCTNGCELGAVMRHFDVPTAAREGSIWNTVPWAPPNTYYLEIVVNTDISGALVGT